MNRITYSALFWLLVATAAAVPSFGLLGILLLVLGALVSKPFDALGVPADFMVFAWLATAAVIFTVALAHFNAGRQDAARSWGTAFVHLAGLMTAIATTASVHGWSLT
jgi:energy-converting hydrogenase Eha subunit H